MQGGHPFELRKKGGMDVCLGTKKRLFASVCHPFPNGLGTRLPGRPSISVFLANYFRQISTRKIWFFLLIQKIFRGKKKAQTRQISKEKKVSK
jgi:hypothetical protein